MKRRRFGLSFLFSLKSSRIFRAMLRHWEVDPSLRNALWARDSSLGFCKSLSPSLLARIFEAIVLNSCKTEIGLISETRSVNDPSSLLLGIIEIMAFRHEIKVSPPSKAVLMNETNRLNSGVGVSLESSVSRRTKSELTPSQPAA